MPAMEIVGWVISEMMDDKTCDECIARDGTFLPADSPEWSGPLGDLAHDHCRAFWVPVYEMGTLDFTNPADIPALVYRGGTQHLPEAWEDYPSPAEGLKRMQAGVITLDEEMELLQPFELMASYLGLVGA